MNNGKISVRYARALYNTAKELHCDKVIYDQLVGFLIRYEDNMAEINNVLNNPVINKTERQNLLELIIGQEINPCLKDFVALVVERHREDKMYLIARKYTEFYREENMILQTQLTTATKLTQSTLNDIKSYVEKVFGSKVELRETIDPKIIGGFVIDVEGQRYDVSVTKQLRRLRNTL